ncbi:hypothetical protein P261_00189 [Lachnospiraceae bacterium TWA4]|nr:hypothetical protein P261_00189 [Lachnospiraceae bacterium TWA4]
MNRTVAKVIKNYIQRYKQKKLWYKVVSCLSAIVVFVTVYALILPAITLEDKTYCGYEGHVHSVENGCYENQLVCNLPEDEEHTHEEGCYKQVLICEKIEHNHSTSCYSDLNADVETADKWEKTFKGVELTGKWDEDIVAIAASQIGYTESEKNFIVLENESEEEVIKGYSRYGAWGDNPYGDWSVMFANFCLYYAKADTFPLNINGTSTEWMNQLKECEIWKNKEDYKPESGDLVFLDSKKEDTDNLVGIVESYNEEKQEIYSIVGDMDNQVQEYLCASKDDGVIGYCSMALAMDKFMIVKVEKRSMK